MKWLLFFVVCTASQAFAAEPEPADPKPQHFQFALFRGEVKVGEEGGTLLGLQVTIRFLHRIMETSPSKNRTVYYLWDSSDMSKPIAWARGEVRLEKPDISILSIAFNDLEAEFARGSRSFIVSVNYLEKGKYIMHEKDTLATAAVKSLPKMGVDGLPCNDIFTVK
jgi:hypothetical protein